MSSPARRLILVKHSKPQIRPGAPPNTWVLGVEGRQRCLALAEQLRPHPPSLIITSREPKAAETGRIAAAVLDIPCMEVDHLHEHDRTGEPFGTQESFEARVKDLFDQPSERVYGSESADEAHARFRSALVAQMAAHEGTLAVVAHGTVITLLVSRLLDLEPFDLWSKLRMPAMLVLDVDPEHIQSADLVALTEEIH
jgi:broad specificity phosphatase PhoE